MSSLRDSFSLLKFNCSSNASKQMLTRTNSGYQLFYFSCKNRNLNNTCKKDNPNFSCLVAELIGIELCERIMGTHIGPYFTQIYLGQLPSGNDWKEFRKTFTNMREKFGTQR